MAEDPNVNTTGLVTRDGPISLTDLYYLREILERLSTALTVVVDGEDPLTVVIPPGTSSIGVEPGEDSIIIEGEGNAGTPSGRLLTVQGDPAGTPVPVADVDALSMLSAIWELASGDQNLPFNIAANATHNAIKGSAGHLIRVVINKKGASSNILTLYNNTTATGTVIAIIDTTTDVASLEYGLNFSIGLSAILGTGTAADVTLVYR